MGSSALTARPMTYGEALIAARESVTQQNEVRRTEITARADHKIADITTDYNAAVLSINTEAGKRGLLGSTVVLHQLERALADKVTRIERVEFDRDVALKKYEDATESKIRAEARRIMSSEAAAARLAHEIDNESIERRIKNDVLTATEAQKALDEEVYAEYLRWLLSKPDKTAFLHVTGDPIFYHNLSNAYYNKLVAEIEKRVIEFTMV
jgi:septal ring factor EnvC (AmiA/AmiB activator)